MALDPTTPRSRRALLTAAAAATVATVVEAVARPLPVSAAGDDGNAIKIGDQWDDVRSRTSLKNVTDDTTVLWLETTSGTAVHGQATTGWGIEGVATGSDSSAIGVYGHAGGGTGVYGNAELHSAVLGDSLYGTGVRGRTFGARIGSEDQGYGVRGDATGSGYGVYGSSTIGSGVYAESAGGTALHIEGKTHSSRSGKATVLAGHRSVDVTVPGGLSGTPLCFANLRIYRSGVAVAAVRPNWPSSGKIRIYLTKVMTSSTSVSWMVMD